MLRAAQGMDAILRQAQRRGTRLRPLHSRGSTGGIVGKSAALLRELNLFEFLLIPTWINGAMLRWRFGNTSAHGACGIEIRDFYPSFSPYGFPYLSDITIPRSEEHTSELQSRFD